ncbi:C4-dicarboxylate ABC transporter [Campylobacter mucosalis]|uniref:C4-dicarboxylate transporter DcuC n=1 Tax=Campylobacter mucosalis TaxID=202 RepID=UPI0004D39AD5|nr:C4-dicarboxylate transporter DcuC [Campylobacter mucosalis]KEA45989.1 C4-dicarboxylate ABC transporter [Campylobacter mucosalis]QKF63595.1 C4-dicarboxylate transporter, DcuC family [Campylobacter mucosalis]
MDYKIICAIVGLFAVIYLLVRKGETRTVLIGVGLVLCVVALNPMMALTEFTASMTKAGLIKAICASMGFAYVMKYTKCDQHLVILLTKPMKNIGFLLIPITFLLTYFINIAIPSAAGCSAAVGATLIPLLMSSGVKPAMAGAAVLAGTFGGVLSPGSAHNIFVAEMTKMSVTEMIAVQFPNAILAGGVVLVMLSVTAIIFKDYQKGQNFNTKSDTAQMSDFKANIFYALTPLIPLVILVIGGTSLNQVAWLKWTKMGVAEAMLLGAIIAIFITWTNPQKITKEFFSGMGSAYAEVIGIIIAAGVFVAGLKACGAIEAVTVWLKNSQEFVRFGGTFAPYLMGAVTGSGDAATMAFNTAITPHAAELGFEQSKLGMAAAIAGALGRSSSPIAGAAIICAGLAMVSPVEIVKRTAPAMFVSVALIAFFML